VTADEPANDDSTQHVTEAATPASRGSNAALEDNGTEVTSAATLSPTTRLRLPRRQPLIDPKVFEAARQAVSLAGSTKIPITELAASVRNSLDSFEQMRELLLKAAQQNILSGVQQLSDSRLYANPEPLRSPYSSYLTHTSDYFSKDEYVIESVHDLNVSIATLVDKAPNLTLVWRGQQDVEWGIHSSLFRTLSEQNGVVRPHMRPKGEQPFPTEEQMVSAERAILSLARSHWRFDGMTALETFARIQHAGGRTRLLDVTFNPYIAAWFATEANDSTDSEDARLVAFATTPVTKEGKPPSPSSRIELDEVWGGHFPAWHALENHQDRVRSDWGTGSLRRLWVPPAYDPRISGQNAAFVLDGVPITSSKTASYFRASKSKSAYFKRADLLAAGSLYMRTASPTRKPRYNAQQMAPTFPFRITAPAKVEIRTYLERTFGYSKYSLYPDINALAAETKSMIFEPLQ
jgi:hypothetical protein